MSENVMLKEKAMNRAAALADMDKANAMMQELDPDEMERVSGGEWCLADWGCVYVWWHDGICVLELPFD